MLLPTRPTRRGPGRPEGALGEVAQAMLDAAREAPGTAIELARRALVGDRVGMYTASRLIDAGHLVRLTGGRPAVLAAPSCAAVCLLPDEPPAESPAVMLLGRLFPMAADAGGASRAGDVLTC